MGRFDLRPGEEEFNTGDKSWDLHQRSRSGSVYGRVPAVKLDQPRFDASDEEEQAWAEKVHHSEMRRQGEAEKSAYQAGRSGLSYTGDEDPGVAEAHKVGEEMHAADRRHDFLIGIGTVGRHMAGMVHSGGHGGPGKLLAAGRSAWRY